MSGLKKIQGMKLETKNLLIGADEKNIPFAFVNQYDMDEFGIEISHGEREVLSDPRDKDYEWAWNRVLERAYYLDPVNKPDHSHDIYHLCHTKTGLWLACFIQLEPDKRFELFGTY